MVNTSRGQKNVHQTLFIPLSVSCFLYAFASRRGNKEEQPPPENTHINILFEFLTSLPQQLSDLMTWGSLINSRTLFRVCVVDIE